MTHCPECSTVSRKSSETFKSLSDVALATVRTPGTRCPVAIDERLRLTHYPAGTHSISGEPGHVRHDCADAIGTASVAVSATWRVLCDLVSAAVERETGSHPAHESLVIDVAHDICPFRRNRIREHWEAWQASRHP
jgi:hypothetical protein